MVGGHRFQEINFFYVFIKNFVNGATTLKKIELSATARKK